MDTKKTDRIGRGYGVGIFFLLAALLAHLIGWDAADSLGPAFEVLLIITALPFFRAYYLDDEGLTAKILFIPYRRIRWTQVNDIRVQSAKDMLHICLMESAPRTVGVTAALRGQGGRCLFSLPLTTTARFEYFEKHWGHIQTGRFLYEQMIRDELCKLEKWERGNALQRLYAKILRMFP